MSFNNLLLRAMRGGANQEIKVMLENVNVRYLADQMGSTLLHYSSVCGNENITSYLIRRGCYVNVQDVKGITPLMLALLCNHGAVVRVLLEAGADIDRLVCMGQNTLEMVFKMPDGPCTGILTTFLNKVKKDCRSHEQLVDRLLKSGCQLYHAIFLKDTKLIQRMLDRGYEVGSKHPSLGYTALHIAVTLSDLDNVKLLLDYGADPNSTDVNDQTPLFNLYNYSSELCDDKLEILKMLLDRQVPLMTYTCRGFYQVGPALSRACSEGIRRILQSSDIDFTAKDRFDQKTILHYLAMNNNPGVVEHLKPYVSMFDVNALDKYGTNPLYCAVEEGSVDLVKFLLDHGAQVNIAHNVYGFTPICFPFLEFQIDSDSKHDSCTELLLQHNADPQISFLLEAEEGSTIFDVGLDKKTFYRMKLVLAHLAILESKGTPITERIQSKINSRLIIKRYFLSCQQILKQNIFGSITLSELFTCDDKKMMRYLRNEKLVMKLMRISYKYKLKSLYPYYFNNLEKRICKIIRIMRLKDNAASVICKIFKGCFSETNIITEKIISYMDNQTLIQLYKLFVI